MPLEAPDLSLFSMANIMADAISLANMVLDYWMFVLGLSLGTAIMFMVFKHIRRAVAI